MDRLISFQNIARLVSKACLVCFILFLAFNKNSVDYILKYHISFVFIFTVVCFFATHGDDSYKMTLKDYMKKLRNNR